MPAVLQSRDGRLDASDRDSVRVRRGALGSVWRPADVRKLRPRLGYDADTAGRVRAPKSADEPLPFLGIIVGMAWMFLYMPFWRRRVRRAAANAPRWELHPER
jgi:hypothetical protein